MSIHFIIMIQKHVGNLSHSKFHIFIIIMPMCHVNVNVKCQCQCQCNVNCLSLCQVKSCGSQSVKTMILHYGLGTDLDTDTH